MSTAYPLAAEETRFLRRETLKAVMQGSIPPAVAMWFLFTDFPMPLWGGDGFAAFQFKNSFGMAAVMTLLMSLGLRAGRAKGKVPGLGWSREAQPLLRIIPRNLLLRVAVFALANMAIIGSLTFIIAITTAGGGVQHLPFVLFMASQCALNALVLAPFILIGAMTDPVTTRTKAAA